MILSEYGITPVSKPVHINRHLRNAGYLQLREERGFELLDAGECRAFALADHQVAHIYLKDPKDISAVKKLIEGLPGVDMVLDDAGKKAHHLDHERAGDLVAIASADSWFTYYYWLDDARAPDFARIVEIHRKPGYDPVEMFLDPEKKLIVPRIVMKLLKKKLGFRTLMNVIPLHAELVHGSHGRTNVSDRDKPVLISKGAMGKNMAPTDICGHILDTVFKS